MIRRALPAAVVAWLLLGGSARADVIFAEPDGQALAATLARAYEAQGVCYGWDITVADAGANTSSTGSNFGQGVPLRAAEAVDRCAAVVELRADVVWTSVSSDLQDSAEYSLYSSDPDGPTTADLDELGLISVEGLLSERPGVDVYNAVAALPVLAADAGLATPIAATPAAAAPQAAAADSGEPGFWRGPRLLLPWGVILLVGGLVFAVYAAVSARRQRAIPTRGARRY